MTWLFIVTTLLKSVTARTFSSSTSATWLVLDRHSRCSGVIERARARVGASSSTGWLLLESLFLQCWENSLFFHPPFPLPKSVRMMHDREDTCILALWFGFGLARKQEAPLRRTRSLPFLWLSSSVVIFLNRVRQWKTLLCPSNHFSFPLKTTALLFYLTSWEGSCIRNVQARAGRANAVIFVFSWRGICLWAQRDQLLSCPAFPLAFNYVIPLLFRALHSRLEFNREKSLWQKEFAFHF